MIEEQGLFCEVCRKQSLIPIVFYNNNNTHRKEISHLYCTFCDVKVAVDGDFSMQEFNSLLAQEINNVENSEPFKVIIAGGRNFDNYLLLKEKTDKILKNKNNICIVSGKARGADSLGERYAKEKGFQIKEFPADWNKYGKKAGTLRNAQMGEYADALIAFWDGKSVGTKHMIQYMQNHKKLVRIIYY